MNKFKTAALALMLACIFALSGLSVLAEDRAYLTAEERANHVGIYVPLGVAFKVAPSYENSTAAKRRHQGFESGPEDLITFSREYRFRYQALVDKLMEINEAQISGKQKAKRIEAEVRDKELPLFGFFTLKKALITEEMDLAEALGYKEVKVLRENASTVQVFAKGEAAPDLLTGADLEAYTQLYKDIDVVEESLRVFEAKPVEEALKDFAPWTFEAEDLDGNKVDQSILKSKDLTYVCYWATWCPHCLLELSTLSWFEQIPMVQDHVQILGVVSDLMAEEKTDQGVMAVKGILKQRQVHFQNLVNSVALEDGMFLNAMNYPTGFFVDKEGKILKVYIGEPSLQGLLEDAREILITELGVDLSQD